MRRSLLLLPLAATFALLAGCGNKGPLVLPPARSVPTSNPPAAAPAPATSAHAARTTSVGHP